MMVDDEPTAPRLSKSKYLAGQQCLRRLWLGAHTPEVGTSKPPEVEAILAMGTEIGGRARELFANGVLVDEEAWQHQEAVERTRHLLTDPTVGAIFEAAFEHAGVRVRVDVLERLADGAWGIREVKSGTSLKDVHLHDVAVQRFVVEGAGVRLGPSEVVHIDGTYVRGDDGVDWSRLFAHADVTESTATLLHDIPARVAALHAILAMPEAPAVEPSSHCFRPYDCEFWAHCTKSKPADWVFQLPGLRSAARDMFRSQGVERITQIPDDFPLKPVHARIRTAWRAGALHIVPELSSALLATGPPADYLDFETAFPAVPLYAGTRPYEQVPFQWSLHRVDGGEGVQHDEFLADGRTDPRAAFADALLAALREPNGPILVWSAFEAGVLDGLAHTLPHRAAELQAVRARIVDLLPIVRAHVYHPGFGGSFSIKRVAPALVPGFGYDDLETIADGGAAARALVRLASDGFASAEEATQARQSLLAYCRRDTLAMVEVHRRLRECAPGNDSRTEREQLEELLPFLDDEEVLTTDWKLLRRDDLMTQIDDTEGPRIVTVVDLNDPWQSGGRGHWLRDDSGIPELPTFAEELARRKTVLRALLRSRSRREA